MKKTIKNIIILFFISLWICGCKHTADESNITAEISITKQPETNFTFNLYDNLTNKKDITIQFKANSTGPKILTANLYVKNTATIESNEITPSVTKSVDITEEQKEYTVTFTLPQINYLKADVYCELNIGDEEKTYAQVQTEKCSVTQNMVNTGLPIVYINTKKGEAVDSKDVWRENCSFKLINSNGEELNEVTKIKGRGNSSWNMPKKSYSLKFENKQKPLGMKNSKKWVLIANYSDKSLFRNWYTSYLGNEIFNTVWNPSFEFVDFLLNGEYLGTYLLGEQIKIEEKRVNIQSLADVVTKPNKCEDLNDDEQITLEDGGFILEIDSRLDANFHFDTVKGVHFCLKDPDTDDFIDNATTLDAEISDYIISKIQTAEDSLYGNNFKDENLGYRKYYNVDSFVDWYIVNEFAKNNDSIFFSSVYMYYNPNDCLIYLGPNWDYDIGFGNINYGNCGNAEGEYIYNTKYIKQLFKDSYFVEKVKNRWNSEKTDLLESFQNELPEEQSKLIQSTKLNFIRWQILGEYVWPNPPGYEYRNSYIKEYEFLTDWIEERYNWMDTFINAL